MLLTVDPPPASRTQQAVLPWHCRQHECLWLSRRASTGSSRGRPTTAAQEGMTAVHVHIQPLEAGPDIRYQVRVRVYEPSRSLFLSSAQGAVRDHGDQAMRAMIDC